jgi:uncharacterized membrane protein
MTGWHADPTPDKSARAVISVMLLALLLVAAVPLALLTGVILILVGHAIVGLALAGGSILAAVLAVAIAGMSGMRHLRKLVTGRAFSFPGAPPDSPPQYPDAVRLDRSDYTEVR